MMPAAPHGPAEPLASHTGIKPGKALLLPLIFISGLVLLAMLPSVRAQFKLQLSFLGAGAVLFAWYAVLLGRAVRLERTFTLDIVLRSQHYVQICAQMAVIVYWGAYWQNVYDSASLILAQVIFAYAFDALLTWSRRQSYAFGFGPIPIILSTNLFLWFKPDWFYLQFVLVAVGFLAKELIKWNKDGRKAHIFNPSSFPLALFSLVLLLTQQSDLCWGQQISLTQLNPPHIYLLIFLVSLPAQYLFGVTLTTMSAVVTTYVFGLLYFPATGIDFNYSSHIPIAVFLGMHLLFNDPSTSPRSGLGRIIFGILYGLSIALLYTLLQDHGYPTFYDKLLPVPILNLLAPSIDRIAGSSFMQRLDPTRLVAGFLPRHRNLVYISIWIAFFAFIQVKTGESQKNARLTGMSLQLLGEGKTQEAITQLDTLAQDSSINALVLIKAGKTLITQGRLQEAISPLQRALEIQPDHADAHHNLAFALASVGQPQAGVHHYYEAIRLKPDWPVPLSSLALLRASHPFAEYRDPAEAVELAMRALAVSDKRDPVILNSLAAGYAAANRFEDAIRTAREAEALAAVSSPKLAARIRARLELYRAGRPLFKPDNADAVPSPRP